MRRLMVLLVAFMTCAGPARAADRDDEIVGGILRGVLGGEQVSPSQKYSAQERDRLVASLASGDYVTSRQGEPIDMMVYGIPLTHKDRVYTAKPIPPSRTTYGQ